MNYHDVINGEYQLSEGIIWRWITDSPEKLFCIETWDIYQENKTCGWQENMPLTRSIKKHLSIDSYGK